MILELSLFSTRHLKSGVLSSQSQKTPKRSKTPPQIHLLLLQGSELGANNTEGRV